MATYSTRTCSYLLCATPTRSTLPLYFPALAPFTKVPHHHLVRQVGTPLLATVRNTHHPLYSVSVPVREN